MNIPDNHICGRCGANLPLIYDEAGKTFDWSKSPIYRAVYLKKGSSRGLSVNSVRWMLRVAVLLLAFLVAFFIRRH